LLVLFASNYSQRLPLAYLQGLLENDWGAGQTRNTSGSGGPFVDEDRLRAFIKRPCAQRARELLNFNRNQLRVMTGPSNRRL
jgi:hypothetical protein